MKKILLITLFIFPICVFSKEKIICELSFEKSKLEVVYLEKGCDFPQGKREDCALIRFKDAKGNLRLGASPLRKVSEKICQHRAALEVFGPTMKDDPTVWLECLNNTKEKKITLRLEAPQKKFEKICAWPF